MNIEKIVEAAVAQLENDGVQVCCDIDENADIAAHCEYCNNASHTII